ncbi:MAG: TMEM43 family protein, partial [Anaerolineales bacterium]|nr:TMEM43 family protein [Anaerolineales bacterium]
MSFKLRRRRRRMNNPFIGILFGIGLFFGSFILLYLNEGRVDLSKIAVNSIPVSAETVNSENQEKLVAVSGILHADEPLGDPELLTTSNYLQLERLAEMYAWEESSSEDDDGTKSYDYKRDWTGDPENSQNFDNPNGHFNPPMKYQDAEFTVPAASLGSFSVNPNSLFFMQKEDVALREGMLLQGHLAENYIFIGKGTLNEPEVGDLRISYKAFPNDQSVTLFGEQYENQLRPYIHKDDTLLYRVYPSDRETAIASMHTEFLTLLWGFRVGGFIMMWLGLMVIASPLTRLLGYLPILGNAGRFVINLVALAIAAVLSLITVIVSAILHSPIALITILLLLIAGGVFLWRNHDQ